MENANQFGSSEKLETPQKCKAHWTRKCLKGGDDEFRATKTKRPLAAQKQSSQIASWKESNF